MLVFRRSNCIVRASGIVTLRKQLFSALNVAIFISDVAACIFTILTCNFSKEQYVLLEDDLRIETCRSILSVSM